MTTQTAASSNLETRKRENKYASGGNLTHSVIMGMYKKAMRSACDFRVSKL